MAPFKDELSPEVVERLADVLLAAWPAFPRDAVVAAATDGLPDLELKARAERIAAALAPALPTDVDGIERLVDRALASPGFAGWGLWPFLDAVAARTLDAPERGLELLRRATHRWTAEGAVRPFLAAHPDLAFTTMLGWADDPDEHVRRLASEGTRPRLPWSPVLRASVVDPSRGIAILDRLRDDPSAYVRRSVANHLNDVGRDHPDVAVAVAARWRDGGGRHVDAVVRHGLRGLVKRGDPEALRLVGADVGAEVALVALVADPPAVPIGGATTLRTTLRAEGGPPAAVEVDIRVAYADATGARTRRATFKHARRALPPGADVAIARAVPFRPATIRRLHPGRHVIEVLVNGRALGSVEIDLLPPPDGGRSE